MEKRPAGWKNSNNESKRYGSTWVKLRCRILNRDRYLCQCEECKRDKRLTYADEVDHVIPVERGGSDAEWNLQAINHDCHKRKTVRDRYGLNPDSGRCNIDGLPLDPNHPWNKGRLMKPELVES
jgi:HNH endonuclease